MMWNEKLDITYEYGIEDLIVECDRRLENRLRGQEQPVGIRLQDRGAGYRVRVEIVLVEGDGEGRDQGEHQGRPRDA